MGKKPPQEIGIKVKNHSGGGVSLTHNKNFRKLLKEIIGDTAPRLTELNTKEFAGFQVGLLNKVNCDIDNLLGVVGGKYGLWNTKGRRNGNKQGELSDPLQNIRSYPTYP